MAPPCAIFDSSYAPSSETRIDGGALGVEQLGHLLEQHHQQAIEIERGAEHAPELADGVDLACARSRSRCSR